MRKILLFVGLLLSSLEFVVIGADLTLVENGIPLAEIVCSDNPSKVVQLAAFELRHHIQKITGASLPIVNQASEGKLHILLGAENRKPQRESSSIEFSATQIHLYGTDLQTFGKVDYNNHNTFPGNAFCGTLYAVYDFLERYCGVRWYGIGETATACQKKKTLTVTAKDRHHSPPADAFRNIWTGTQFLFFKANARDVNLWNMRWRMVSYYGSNNHNIYPIYFKYWGKAQKDPKLAELFIEKRPQYFGQGYKGRNAANDGFLRRQYPDDLDLPSTICFSNQEVIDFFADQAVRQWHGEAMPGLPSGGRYQKRLDDYPFFSSVQHQDTQGNCYCPDCSSRVANGENIMWQWIADIAKRAAEKQPGLGVSTLAYQKTLAYPDAVQLPENLSVQLCLGISSWWNPEFYQIQHDEIYQKWINNAGPRIITCWLYFFGPFHESRSRYKHKFFPGIYVRQAAKICRDMVNDGVKGFFIEAPMQHVALAAYLAMKIAYDPDFDTEEVLAEHFNLFYGKAAPPMAAFYREMEEIFWNHRNYPDRLFGDKGIAKRLRYHSLGSGMLNAADNWSVMNDERMARLQKYIEDAQALVETDEEKIRLSWIRDGFWDQAVEGYKDHKKREMAKLLPVKVISIPLQADCGGEVAKVDFEQSARTANCHMLNTGLPAENSFDLRIAADQDYLYLEFLENQKQVNPGFWSNFFELFLSADGQMPVAQIALAPTSSNSLNYTIELINDVQHSTTSDFGQKTTVLANDESWHWKMSIPRRNVPGGGKDTIRLNFRRWSASGNLVWNGFWSNAAELVADELFGYAFIRSQQLNSHKLGFDEKRIKGEISSWYLRHGQINKAGGENASVTFEGKDDYLRSTRQIAVYPGSRITLEFSAQDLHADLCLDLFSGQKPVGSLTKKVVSKTDVMESFIETFEISPATNVTSIQITFHTRKNGIVCLSSPTVTVADGASH